MSNVGALGETVLTLQILHLDHRGYKNQDVLNIKLADKKTPLFPNNREANSVRQRLLKKHKRGRLETPSFTLQDRALLADDCNIATKLFELVTSNAQIPKYSPPSPPTDKKMSPANPDKTAGKNVVFDETLAKGMGQLDLIGCKPKGRSKDKPRLKVLSLGYNDLGGGVLLSASKARTTDCGKFTVPELKIQKTVNTDEDTEDLSIELVPGYENSLRTGTSVLKLRHRAVPSSVCQSSALTLAHINATIKDERDSSKVDDRQHESDNVNRENAHHDAVDRSRLSINEVLFQVADDSGEILDFNTANWQNGQDDLKLIPIVTNVLVRTDKQTVLRPVAGGDPEEVEEDVPRYVTNVTWLISVDRTPISTGRSPPRNTTRRRGAKLTRNAAPAAARPAIPLRRAPRAPGHRGRDEELPPPPQPTRQRPVPASGPGDAPRLGPHVGNTLRRPQLDGGQDALVRPGVDQIGTNCTQQDTMEIATSASRGNEAVSRTSVSLQDTSGNGQPSEQLEIMPIKTPVGRLFEEEMEEDEDYQSMRQRLAAEKREDDLMISNLMDANMEGGFKHSDTNLQVLVEEKNPSLESKKPLSLGQKFKRFFTRGNDDEEEDLGKSDDSSGGSVYTTADTRDSDDNDPFRHENKSNEPLRQGDEIEYYHPQYVHGNPFGHRKTTVKYIKSACDDYPIVCDNGDVLASTLSVRRSKVIDSSGRLNDHKGINREIRQFRMKKSREASREVQAMACDAEGSVWEDGKRRSTRRR